MSSSHDDLEIVIIGAGIGGLTMAAMLHQKNIRCRVFERDRSFDSRSQGYSLTIQQGFAALEQIGLGEKIRSLTTVCGGQETYNAVTGESLVANFRGPRTRKTAASKVQSNANARGRLRCNVAIPRQELRRLLLELIPAEMVEWGAQLTHCEDIPDGRVRVHFADGRSVLAQGVVACDGLASKAREQLLPDRVRPLGVGVVMGIADFVPDETRCAHVFQIVDGRARMFSKPFSPGRYMWQITYPVRVSPDGRYLDRPLTEEEGHCPSPAAAATTTSTTTTATISVAEEEGTAGGEGSVKVETDSWLPNEMPVLPRTDAETQHAGLEQARRLISAWRAYPAAELVENSPEQFIRVGLMYDRDPVEPWATQHVTLLGDSAHPMSPFKGQGANTALIDAQELARELERAKPLGGDWIIEAFRRHEEGMMHRCKGRVLRSRAAVKFLHTPDALNEEHLAAHLRGERADDGKPDETVEDSAQV